MSHNSNKYKLFGRSFLSAIGGGITVVLVIIFVSLICNKHHHTYRPISIVAHGNLDSSSNNLDSKVRELDALNNKGILLTPAEYTNNIVNYYNTIITLLIALLAIFSILSYLHLNSIAEEKLKKTVADLLRNSDEIKKVLIDNFQGRVDDIAGKLPNKNDIEILQTRIKTLEDMNGLNDLDDLEDISDLENLKIEK